MKLDNCEFVLMQYGAWTRQQALPIGYRSPSAALMDIAPERRIVVSESPAAICDDLALRIDSYVGDLCRDEPDIARAVLLYYCHGKDVRGTAAVLGLGRTRAGELIKMGTASIAACLRMERRVA